MDDTEWGMSWGSDSGEDGFAIVLRVDQYVVTFRAK
jgi:hypothetical protein